MIDRVPGRAAASEGSGPDVQFRAVGKNIDGKQVLRDLSFVVQPGERLALIGPSGSGKTTLLRLIAGVLWPTTGTVTVLGEETGTLHGRRLCRFRKQIGFLYQQDNLVPGLRVAHNVLMGRLGTWSIWKSLLSLIRPQEIERAHGALERVELGNRLWSLPDELSGGEQQRVALARLLVQEPRLMLADEPVSALDIRLGREVVRLLLDLTSSTCSLITSLHTLELLREGFDRVLALRAGEIVFDGAPTDLRRSLLQEVYGAEYRALHLDELPLEPQGG